MIKLPQRPGMGHHAGETRRNARRLLASVPLPRPFDLQTYLGRIEGALSTKIYVEPARNLLSPGAPCGLWVRTDEADFIFHAPSSSSSYVRHIICHEIGHLLWGHRASMDLGKNYVAQLLPGLDPAAVVKVLGRESYATEQERQAETFARLLASEIRMQGPRQDANGAAKAIDRLFG